MTTAAATPLRIALPGGGSTSAVLLQPDDVLAAFVFAHGAGAGMNHAFMASLAAALGRRGIATLRFQFPSMEAGSKRPDVPAVAHGAIRAAVAGIRERLPDVPLLAGGKSFGGRMTSQAQALEPLGAQGLIFVGFPLHPAGKPATERAAHLAQVDVPMLFLQGTRDALADLALVRETVGGLGPRATLHVVDGADHSFHVPARSGRTDGEVIEELADAVLGWITSGLPRTARPPRPAAARARGA
ncbi:MAG: alpha/beta family hydrolase [Pseudomonadota bacterium]